VEKEELAKLLVVLLLHYQLQKKDKKNGENILLVSTDPAHNLSDAFDQKLTSIPSKINGFDNLFAMEIDPQLVLERDLVKPLQETAGIEQEIMEDLRNFLNSMPGIDEAMALSQVMSYLEEDNKNKYSVIIFDTAPTGHTLRLLSLPSVLELGISKIMNWKTRLSGIIQSFTSIFMPQTEEKKQLSVIEERLTNIKQKIAQISDMFKDKEKTTFICVCIPEFLSIYETERLVFELKKHEINANNLIINQLVFPGEGHCDLCLSRAKMQKKYVDEAYSLFGKEFHIIKLPLLPNEVRGTQALLEFSKNLLQPYQHVTSKRKHPNKDDNNKKKKKI